MFVSYVLMGCVSRDKNSAMCTIYESGKKSLVEKRPGGKNGSGKKWKESLVERKPGLFWKRWKKSLVSFF